MEEGERRCWDAVVNFVIHSWRRGRLGVCGLEVVRWGGRCASLRLPALRGGASRPLLPARFACLAGRTQFHH